jgi:hypothetical protein
MAVTTQAMLRALPVMEGVAGDSGAEADEKEEGLRSCMTGAW